MSNMKACAICMEDPKKCVASLQSVGNSKYQCFKGHIVDLSPYLNYPYHKIQKEKIKVDIYKVEVYIDDFSQQPVPLLGHGRLTKDVRLVADEEQAKAMIQQAKAIAKAMFRPKEGELEQRFHQDQEHVVEAEYFVDNHEGAVGELFAIYSRI